MILQILSPIVLGKLFWHATKSFMMFYSYEIGENSFPECLTSETLPKSSTFKEHSKWEESRQWINNWLFNDGGCLHNVYHCFDDNVQSQTQANPW